MAKLRHSILLRFLPLLTYIALLYGSLPYVRGIADFLRKRNLLRFTMYSFSFFVALVLFYFMTLHIKLKKNTAVSIIVFFGIVYCSLFRSLKLPEENAHFIEYSLVYPIVVYSLRPYFKKHMLFIGSFLLAILIGWGDESIQSLIPGRYFEWSDVGLNVVGAFLGMGVYLSILYMKARLKEGENV